ETEVNNIAGVEATVNRWIVDYYSHLALDFFKNKKYAEFCGIRDVLQSVLVRPLESSDVTQTKIRVLQFLSRINDGEHLDLTFESDESLTPLESALVVLETIIQECKTAMPELFEGVCTSIKEMIVGLLIKNKEFDHANEVLKKHFPKSMVGKKAIFMGLVKKKSNVHAVIEQIDFQRFKDEMFAFCQRLCPLNLPFLYKDLFQNIWVSEVPVCKRATETSVSFPVDLIPTTSLSPDDEQPNKPAIIQRTRLEMAYTALAAGSVERTFAQLEEEVAEKEQSRINDLSLPLSPAPKKAAVLDSEPDGPFQRDSGSPIVARLVVEPDSQASSQCTAASPRLEPDVRREGPPQSPATETENDSLGQGAENDVSIPVRKIRRSNRLYNRNSTESEQPASDSGDDPQQAPAPKNPPVQKCRRVPQAVCIIDSMDSSPEPMGVQAVPQRSSTPTKDFAPDKPLCQSKWLVNIAPAARVCKKVLYNNAKESKETWSDEESCSSSKKNTSNIYQAYICRKKWSEDETNNLKAGVKRFGEGSWSQIKAYYSFEDRTNVNLKDRWRTLKKSNVV
uniref:Uncharacterized protein n=1 Tax=Gasterosteus aculeatus TaxID=69293 RepID=G3PV88_GASAC